MSDQDEWTSYSQWGMFPTGMRLTAAEIRATPA
jgi:hypothetical protein